MSWLIEDIERNGVAETAAEAQERPVPTFEGRAARTCAGEADEGEGDLAIPGTVREPTDGRHTPRCARPALSISSS